jgi:unsaturated rhamnogalacturonyl hydrolase
MASSISHLGRHSSAAVDVAVCILALSTLSRAPGSAQPRLEDDGLRARQVEQTIRRVADYQLSHPVEYDARHWVMAPLYDGLIDASLTTGDPRYLAAVIRAGRRIAWQPGPATYHADDHAAGHAWLRLYLMDPARDPRMVEAFRKRFDEILEKPIPENLSFLATPKTSGVARTDRWTWADALYMAPPTLGRLAQATGEQRYLKFADAEFKASYDALYDPEAHLFYRDARFIEQRTPNGEKVFWSRGNGWVYAGIPLLLNAMPADYPNRDFYLRVFRDMSPAVLDAQQSDGSWYPNLHDPEQVPVGETSGTALFVFGLAWGVRHEVLDREKYWPAVERGWRALQSRIRRDGRVTYVQPIGAEPKPFKASATAPYGTGAVLLAGAEILRALDAAPDVDPATLFRQASAAASHAPDLSKGM